MGKGRILVVEDDADISKMLRIYFDSQGYEVLIATRGNDALDVCRTKLPNVIVLDINLPDMDGFELLHQKQLNPKIRDIPTIIISSQDPAGEPVVTDAIKVRRSWE